MIVGSLYVINACKFHCEVLMLFSCRFVTVTGKRGSNYRLSLSCNRKSKKLNLTNLFNSQQ